MHVLPRSGSLNAKVHLGWNKNANDSGIKNSLTNGRHSRTKKRRDFTFLVAPHNRMKVSGVFIDANKSTIPFHKVPTRTAVVVLTRFGREIRKEQVVKAECVRQK